jgi:hypothetical protein
MVSPTWNRLREAQWLYISSLFSGGTTQPLSPPTSILFACATVHPKIITKLKNSQAKPRAAIVEYNLVVGLIFYFGLGFFG